MHFDSRKALLPLALIVGWLLGCTNTETRAPIAEHTVPEAAHAAAPADSADQISTYIRCIFEDRDGNLWFGTTTDGVVRYDGRSLDYFNAANGLGSDWVNAITQDTRGDLWFGTRDGLVGYDGSRFMRYTTKQGLANDRVWSLLLDRSGILWIGTYEGVSRFDGYGFLSVPLPAADLSKHPYFQDPRKINAIAEDTAGGIWFATNGGGAYRSYRSTLTRYTEKEGLCDAFVNSMLVDRDGKLWFGTRFGGLCTYDGSTFSNADQQVKDQNVLYQQADGTLWSVNMYQGLCRRDGASTTCFTEKDGEGVRVPMCMLEDRRGQLWLGTGAGLYRLDGGKFTNVTKTGLITGG